MALDADVEYYNDDIKALIARIKKENDRNIFIVGGGQVVSSFLNAGLVDDVFHFAVPILLKEGIPLYSALSKEINFTLIEAVPYKTGILKLHYAPKH
jgi:dihydrofolate reductase